MSARKTNMSISFSYALYALVGFSIIQFMFYCLIYNFSNSQFFLLDKTNYPHSFCMFKCVSASSMPVEVSFSDNVIDLFYIDELLTAFIVFFFKTSTHVNQSES